MVIDENVSKKFKDFFNLNFEKYRDDAYSHIKNKDQVNSLKLHDYMAKKFKFTTSLIQCIEDNFGKECRVWYEQTFLS